MEARGLDSALIHAVVSHGWGMTEGDAQPEHEMERVLFAVDELTGLIGAAALMRPSKSVQDMELSSLRKKFKDKKFAAGCSRETITQGAQLLGWELNDLLERTLQAMKACETDIEAQCAASEQEPCFIRFIWLRRYSSVMSSIRCSSAETLVSQSVGSMLSCSSRSSTSRHTASMVLSSS